MAKLSSEPGYIPADKLIEAKIETQRALTGLIDTLRSCAVDFRDALRAEAAAAKDRRERKG